MYDWYLVHDPEKYNFADLAWIDWYEDSFWGEKLEEESWQSYLRSCLDKRPGKSEQDGDGGDGQQNRKDYRLSHDPAIEKRWSDMKNTIALDPISGLSRPFEGFPTDDEQTRYRFYRGIEKRFPGTLTDGDWEEVKKYEETREWEYLFSECGIRRLTRTTTEQTSGR